MIIKGNQQKHHSYKWPLILLLLLVPILFIRFYDKSNENVPAVVDNEIAYCDAEKVVDKHYKNGDQIFEGGALQSDDFAHSGKYSCKLDAQNRIGLTYVFNNPEGGRRYKVEAWSYNKHPVTAKLNVSAAEEKDFYKAVGEPVFRQHDFWEKWELFFTVPQSKTPELLKIYASKDASENAIFFDDLKITEVEAFETSYTDIFKAEEFEITIDKDGLSKLNENRKRSIEQGLVYHDDSKIRAKIWDDERFKSAKIRHKGDWLDHMGKNPSYRVDMNSEESWQGMQSFSVQDGKTRGFLREWVFFQFLDYADVIRPRYDFIWFKQNKKDRVVFSYEEHFTKNLVENRNRREGPILKLTEDRYWEVTKRTIERWRSLAPTEEKDKAYWSSEIRAFKEGKFKSNEKLKSDFEVAQNLMHQYKYGLQPISKIFDLDRMAKYMALTDICLAHHAVTWHNQRFYYNPVTSLLEPIGFDAYSSEDPKKYAWHIYAEKLYTEGTIHIEPLNEMLYDDEFVKRYIHYLNAYSEPEFLDAFMDGLEEHIIAREQFIQNKHSGYKYNRADIIKKGRKIQIALPAHVNSLQAFETKKESGKRIVSIINQHNFPLEILTGEVLNELENSEDKIGNVIYPQQRQSLPNYVELLVPAATKEIQYKVAGLDSTYSASILNWGVQKDEAPRQKLKTSNFEEMTDVLSLNGNIVSMRSEKILLKEPLIIPADKKLRIPAGAHIILQENAFILSYGQVVINGDKDEPVIIESADGKGGSFTVMQSAERSRIRNVIFKNQNTLNYKGWGLTGAVNFYESDVDIQGVLFIDNNCEDALNIIRSDFVVEESKFNGTYADAFDSDFCTGKVVNTFFSKVGNDAIDASGSVIEVVGCTIEGAGDKGVSAGEQSTIHLNWSQIKDANIGVASKDRSELKANQLTIKNCNTGFTAFQKKPEFGPATIELSNTSMKDVKREYVIEDGSILKK